MLYRTMPLGRRRERAMCLQCAYGRTARMGAGPLMPINIGRDGGIRTRGPLTPSQVRYQAALHPESEFSRF